jgi:hypothetical protein
MEHFGKASRINQKRRVFGHEEHCDFGVRFRRNHGGHAAQEAAGGKGVGDHDH